MYRTTLLILLGGSLSVAQDRPVFSNPISSHSSHLQTQNTILRLGNFYYMTFVNSTLDIYGANTSLIIRKSPVLTSFDEGEYSVVLEYQYKKQVAGGIMHELDGSLYLYFAIFEGKVATNTFYMKAFNSTDPMGPWTKPQPLFEFGQGHNLMDGTVMKHNDKLYWIGTQYVFEVEPYQHPYSLYIYPMESATKISKNGTLLRKPTENWECLNPMRQHCSLQSPFVISNREVNYMVFSAVGTAAESSLSYMSISSHQDPMNISEWSSAPGPVFTSNPDEDALGVRAASFTLSPDGSETWMLFHTISNEYAWMFYYMLPSITKIGWDNLTGEPIFPSVHGFGFLQPVPAGQE